jgi:hypothetical protein
VVLVSLLGHQSKKVRMSIHIYLAFNLFCLVLFCIFVCLFVSTFVARFLFSFLFQAEEKCSQEPLIVSLAMSTQNTHIFFILYILFQVSKTVNSTRVPGTGTKHTQLTVERKNKCIVDSSFGDLHCWPVVTISQQRFGNHFGRPILSINHTLIRTSKSCKRIRPHTFVAIRLL